MERPRLADYKVARLPVGEYMQRRIEPHDDEDTRAGIKEARRLLEHRGVLLLAKHKSKVDIVVTGGFSLETLEAHNSIAPWTIKHDHSLFAMAINGMNQVPGVEIYPVARREDMSKLSPEQQEEMRRANVAYQARMNEAVITPHTTMVIAPFGTRARNVGSGANIRRGVLSLIQTGVPTFVADSSREPGIHVRYTTAISPAPLDFGKQPDIESATGIIRQELARLESLRAA